MAHTSGMFVFMDRLKTGSLGAFSEFLSLLYALNMGNVEVDRIIWF